MNTVIILSWKDTFFYLTDAYNSAEKNKFEENRAAALAEDANNGDNGTENPANAATENGDRVKKYDDEGKSPVETNDSTEVTTKS